jgi:hypothetical protein
MKGHENEREIYIRIIEDNVPEPDQTFTVHLCEEKTRRTLKGSDTTCEVTILDNDNAGVLKFKQDIFVVRPDEKSTTITVQRHNGADGIAVCKVSTRVNNHPQLEGEEILQAGVEFEPFEDKIIQF